VDGVKSIGIIGGIASGKSLVAKLLSELGARTLDADKIGHAVLAEDAEVRQAIVGRWGPGVVAADGSIDRKAVAQRVFAPGDAGGAELEFLEELLHPRIRQRLDSRRNELAATGDAPVVIEPSMLLESGWELPLDVLVMVDASRKNRLARARERGWSEEQFAAREAAQWPVEEKRRRADVVIANDGSPEALRRAVLAFWEKYVVA
jgi:dephospho-CoA kinase